MALLCGVAMAGCVSETSAEDVARDYVPPSWMAEVRAQDEEYMTSMIECLKGQGVEGSGNSGWVGGFVASDESFQPLPGAKEITDAALETCGAIVPEQEWRSLPLGIEYDRMLDVRKCLIVEGYDLPEAPSREAWIDDPTLYDPHWIINQPNDAGQSLSSTEVDRLNAVCTPSSQKFTVFR